MIVRIQATAAQLTADEIREAVPPKVLAAIKAKDQRPLLQAYSVAQEGISKPKIIGETATAIIKWPREAIVSVGKAIKRGLQFFRNHNADSSTEGRKSLGQVVGKITKEISGKLHQIVVGYFPDKEIAADCDVCSIEADAVLKSDDNNNYIAQAIHRLTGIALANSKEEAPAFPGAMRLGAIQAFETPGEPDPKPDDKEKNKRKEIPMTTFEDVRKFIAENNVWPNQLFTEDVMKNDRAFGKLYTEKADLQKQFSEMEANNKKLKEDNDKLQKDTLKTSAPEKLKKFYPEGITDKQKEYLEKRFNPDKIEDFSDDGLKTFVDSELEEFKKMASIFGAGDKDDPDKKTDKKLTPPAPDPEDGELSDVDKVVNNIVNDDNQK